MGRRTAWMWIAVLALAVGVAAAAPTTNRAPVPGAPDSSGGGDSAAKKDGGQGAQDNRGQQSSSPLQGLMFPLLLIGGFVVLYIFMGRGRRRQETRRKQMLANLKKGDKIVSIGGIMGTVIEVREDEITVKVDETNNVRMRFARWAIRGVGEDARSESPQEKKKEQ